MTQLPATPPYPGDTSGPGATLVAPRPIDPRGPRFAAAVTSVVLTTTLLAGPDAGGPLLAFQTLVFALGAAVPPAQPYGWVYRRLVRPRLAPAARLEDPRPPRFAQTVGLAFAATGLAGALLGSTGVFHVAVGFALAAALLNAVFDLCLGCELYLLGHRARARLQVVAS